MKDFLQENWFKVVMIILAVWFLTILSGITLSDSFSIDVCLKEASEYSGLSGKMPQICW